MTSVIFEEWLKMINNQMKKSNRHILLTMDNCPAHTNIKLSNINLKFLPPNTTSQIQPLDQGIIKNFKTYYRKSLMTAVVSQTLINDISIFSSKINVLDSVYWIASSWTSVKPGTIQNCFQKAGFSINAELATDESNSVEVSAGDTIIIIPSLSENETENFVVMDESLDICEPPDTDEIFHAIVNEVRAENSDPLVVGSSEESDEEPLENEKPLPTYFEIANSLATLKHFAINKCPQMITSIAQTENIFQSYLV